MSRSLDNCFKKAIAEANVVISVEGLAIFNFNESNQKWEAILQRNHPSHNLKITIKKYSNGVIEKIGEYKNLGKNERFFIKSDGAKKLSEKAIAEGGKDFKQILDLSDLHGTKLFNTNRNLDLSFLSISDSILYSQNVPLEKYKIEIPDREPIIRRTTDIIGADMICEVGSKLEINTIDNPNLIPPITIEEGVVYQITLDNSCHSPTPEDMDFKHYYDLLDVSERAIVSVAQDDGTDDGTGGDEGEGDDDPPSDPPPKTGSCQGVIVSTLGYNQIGKAINCLSEMLH